MNELEEKIIKFFNKIESPAEYLLINKCETPIEKKIKICQYAIIYIGKEDIMLNREKWEKQKEFERENNLEVDSICLKKNKSLKEILAQLKSKGYEIVHKTFKD